MKLKKYLTETFDKSYKLKPYGFKKHVYVEVFKNPSSSEYRDALKSFESFSSIDYGDFKGKFVRGFFDGKNIFIWRGDIVHFDLRKYYPSMTKTTSIWLVLSKEGIFFTSPQRTFRQIKEKDALELRKKILKFASEFKNVPVYLDETGEKELKI